jgi:hypothetical protein
MNEESLLKIHQILIGVAAGHAALRRLVLEWHSQETGEPMNQLEIRFRGYATEELEALLRDISETQSPDYAKLFDFRKQDPPKI